CRLDALAGIFHRLLHRSLGDLHALAANVDASLVHHGEHRAQAFVLPADKLPDAVSLVAKAHNACWRGVDAKFVLQAHTTKIVALSQYSVVPHEKFWNEEK